MHLIEKIEAHSQGQDRGHDYNLLDPVSGERVGITLRIVGPDSATQARAQIAFADALIIESQDDGTVSAATRERLRTECLAACVVGWEIIEDDQSVLFSQASVIRLLNSARWVAEQVDAYASDRTVHGAIA